VLHHASVPKRDRAWAGAGSHHVAASHAGGLREGTDSPELLRQAAQQALRRGLVTKADLGDVEVALAPFGGLARMTAQGYASPEAFKQALSGACLRKRRPAPHSRVSRQLLVFDRCLATATTTTRRRRLR